MDNQYQVIFASELLNAKHAHPVITLVPTQGRLEAQIFNRRDDWAERQTWTLRSEDFVNSAGWLSTNYSFTLQWQNETWALEKGESQRPIHISKHIPHSINQSWSLFAQKQGLIAWASAGQPTAGSWDCLDLYQGNTADGSPIYTYPYQNTNTNQNQFWGFHIVGTPGPGRKPSCVAMVEQILEAAQGNPYLIGNLLSDPAPIFAAAGYPMQIEDYRAFNRYFLETARPTLEGLARGAALVELASAKCIGCKVGFWSLAAVITAIGAAGLTFLTVGTAPVVALSSAAGIAATTALAFIQGLAALVVFSIDTILLNLCEWIGAC